MTTDNPSMSSQIILPKPETDREDEIFRAIADRDVEIAERIEEIDDGLTKNLAIGDGQGLNSILNPGFELGSGTSITNWNRYIGGNGVAELVSTYRNSGVQSLRLQRTVGGDTVYVLSDAVTLVADSPYVLLYWTRGDGSTAGRHQVYASGAVPQPVAVTSNGITSTTWTLVTVPFTSPPAGSTINVGLYPSGTAPSEIHFDDVMVVPAITYGNIDSIVFDLYRQVLQMLGAFDE